MRTQILLLAVLLPVTAFGSGLVDSTRKAAGIKTDPLKDLKLEESPLEACKGVSLLSGAKYKENKEFWDAAIDKCNLDIEVLPDTSGFFNAMIGKLGEGDENTRAMEFLRKVGARASNYIDINNTLTDVLLHCAKKDEAWFKKNAAAAKTSEEKDIYDYGNCAGAMDKTREAADELGKKARIQLAIMKETASTWKQISGKMKDALGTKLAIENAPILPDEMEAAKKIMAQDAVEVQQETLAKVKAIMEKGFAKGGKLGCHSDKETNMYANWPHFCSTMTNYLRQKGVDFSNANTVDWKKVDEYLVSDAMAASKTALVSIQRPIKEKIFTRHQEEFQKHLGELPLLGYLGAPAAVKPGNLGSGLSQAAMAVAQSKNWTGYPKQSATDEELARAMEQVLKNGYKTKKELDRLLAEGSQEEETFSMANEFGEYGGTPETKIKLSDEDRARKMFDLMKYGPVVNEILKEDPKSCHVATGITNTIFNTDLRDNMALVVGLLGTAGAAAAVGPTLVAGALATPAVFATGAGALFSVGITMRDYDRYVEARTRTFNAVETTDKGKALASVRDFEEARDIVALDLALHPLDFIGSGILGKVLESPSARRALMGALKNKGVSKTEAEQLIKNLSSKNVDTAANAAKTIIEKGVDDDTMKFIGMAAKKGLFADRNPEAINAVLKVVKDKRIAKNLEKIMDKIDPNFVNAANGKQVRDASVAAAEFGIKDPEKFAAHLKEWGSDIEGLTATYRLAAKKMESADLIRRIPDVSRRQEVALKSALDDLLTKNDPNYTKLSAAAKRAQRDEMAGCAL